MLIKKLENIKRKVKFYKDDLQSSEKSYKDLKSNISTTKQKVATLSKIDPALAAIYTIQLGQKDSTLNAIKNTIMIIKNKIDEQEELYMPNNIKFTKMIDKIQLLDNPIKPKKALIVVVAFVTSLIFSIFLIFFLNFIEGMKTEDE